MGLVTRYSILDEIRLFWSLILTKSYFRRAKLIRQPIRIAGKNRMKVGENFVLGHSVE